MSFDMEQFKEYLEDNLEEEIVYINYGDSFGFESDLFLLEFFFESDYFIIKNFESHYKREGNGDKIISLIKNYISDKTNLDIKLENMKETEEAERFWEAVGF